MLKQYTAMLVALGLAIVWGQSVWAQSLSLSSDEMQQLAAYSFGQSRQLLSDIEEKVKLSITDSKAKCALAAQLSGILMLDGASRESKDFVCRQLALIGGASEVRVLEKLLRDPATADMARYALERIPEEEVDRVLLDALDYTEGYLKIGVVNSLANRRSPQAVKPLSAFASGEDELIAEAAIAGLGRIGLTKSHAALLKLVKKVPVSRQDKVLEALLFSADAMGESRRAFRAYSTVYQYAQNPTTKAAALYGLVKNSSYPKNVSWILKGVESGDRYQLAAMRRAIRETHDERTKKRLFEVAAQLTPEKRDIVFDALKGN